MREMTIDRRWPCAMILACLIAAPASAGEVFGKVTMRGPAPGESRVRPEQAVVWVERVPEKTERELARGRKKGLFGRRQPPPAPVLAQKSGRFEPRVVWVPAGRLVVLRNEDRIWHGVFSVSPTRRFDIGKRAPGHADSVRFERAGVVAVRCDLHPDESAFILVTPNHVASATARDGAWRLPPLPEGRYTVRAWAPGRAELRQEVDVPGRGDVKVNLRW